MARVIFHLDMDAFFAAIEQRDNPDLLGKPVIVGSPPTQRGVVCAASYEARKFGVHSALPSVTAGRLCPKGVFVPPRMDRYQAESAAIMKLIARPGALMERMSIDEAYLDMTAVVQAPAAAPCGAGAPTPSIPADHIDQLLAAAVPLARELKAAILTHRGLTATIGIASNKLLAKLASDYNKPNGLTVVTERDKLRFLAAMPVRVLHGVGPVTAAALERAGIRTIEELRQYPGDLYTIVGSFAPTLRAFARGEDDRPLDLDELVKSISSEETFLADTDDRRVLRASLRAQTEDIAQKLQRKQLAAQTVQVKLRYGDFTTLTRQITVEEPVTTARQIFRLACFLLAREKLVNRPLRLIGVGASHLDLLRSRQLTFW